MNQGKSCDKIWMDLAQSLAKMSTCRRSQVGCVVVSSDMQRVLAIGYNGNYRKGPNTCDSDEPGNCGCLHAENNCLIKMDYNDPAKKILYTTLSPCKSCAKQIINAGIQEVVFETPYRKTDGLDVLTSGGVVFRQFTRHPDGSVHLDQDEES